MGKTNEGIIKAFNLGYRVIDNVLYNPNKQVINYRLTGHNRYYTFYVKINKIGYSIMLHRFIAYQKYGDAMFEPGICVRHLDGNCLNNSIDNIVIGTLSENMMDVSEDQRIIRSILASRLPQNGCRGRKFTNNQVQEIRDYYKETSSYKKTKEKYNINGNGTLHYILHANYVRPHVDDVKD